MGMETAIMVGAGMTVGGIVSGMFQKRGMDVPNLDTGNVKSVQAGLSDAEQRRQSVMARTAKMRKATILAKANEPKIQKTTLGPG